MPAPDLKEPLLMASLDLIGRTGAKGVQLRYSDDEKPVVWMAVGTYVRDGREIHQVAADLHPARAAFKLCESVIDGGHCVHCDRPTGITEDFDPMPLSDTICWYQFDPELATFRRACEGHNA